jgi:hypothetical protein
VARSSAGDRAASFVQSLTARAGNRRFRRLSALRAHTKAPYEMDVHRETLRALNRPWAARTLELEEPAGHAAADPAVDQRVAHARVLA